ncbi:MAG: acetylxylan esterase [Lentisphaeria bacterium]|nr:acetylxylan esterase [Lentisphaeria bacterium]
MADKDWKPNYDESRVPEYTLPEALALADGTRVTAAGTWLDRRRPQLMALFQEHVYGRMHGPVPGMRIEWMSAHHDVLGGLALRKELCVRFGEGADAPSMLVLVYLPAAARRPVPGFLTLNFRGNHSICADPGITLTRSWLPRDPDHGIVDHRATEAARGSRVDRWPVERILRRGFMLATVYYGDLDPDFDDGFRNGVHPLFDAPDAPRPPDAWGAIGAWAWGLSRALDCLEKDADVDASRLAVMGHSRLGKTALWAGACDPRFAAVISNNSGCGGAALSRRCYGETVGRITRSFPHWFCPRFREYAERESELPVDQHELIALMAPRPVYVASAAEDRWADPRGEFLSALHADPVYRLLGTEGLPTRDWPPVDHPVHGRIGYHVRTGGHDVKPYDWDQYMTFLEKHGLGPAAG